MPGTRKKAIEVLNPRELLGALYVLKGQSTPWSVADLAIADADQNYLRDVVLRHAEATAEERKRTEVLRKLVNQELDHRVKNILALAKSNAFGRVRVP